MIKDKAYKAAVDAKRKRYHTGELQKIKLARGCADCGYRVSAVALDFDHLYDKKFTISRNLSYKWSTLLLEIAKCDVVCANCHRIRTANRRAIKQGSSPEPTDLSVK